MRKASSMHYLLKDYIEDGKCHGLLKTMHGQGQFQVWLARRDLGSAPAVSGPPLAATRRPVPAEAFCTSSFRSTTVYKYGNSGDLGIRLW